MLVPTIVTTDTELQDILHLQQLNLKQHVDAEEMKSQGFLTVQHTMELLQLMHAQAPGIIVKDEHALAGYALTMPRSCRQLIPALEPMFHAFDQLIWKGKLLNDYDYYAMGQICVAKQYRGMGVFDMLYQHHRHVYQSRFDFIITEVSTSNTRSLRAHERVGFTTIHTYRDALDEWAVVLWEW